MPAPALQVMPLARDPLVVDFAGMPALQVVSLAETPIAIEHLADPVEVVLTAAVRGAPGRDGDTIASFEFSQNSPSAIWTVNHNLGRKPAAVSVRSAGGREVVAEVLHISANQLQILFAAPATGSVVVQ